MDDAKPGDGPERFWEDERFLRDEGAVPRRPRPSRTPIHGDARWATEADLERLLRPSGNRHDMRLPAFSPLVETEDGLAPRYARTLHLDEELWNRHLLVIGQTGSGKTQRAMLPWIHSQLGDPERSLVVFDAKCDLYEPIDELARLAGRDPADVIRLDLTDPGRSIGWNPLGPEPDAVSAFDLAHQVCHATERRSSQDSAFWVQTSVDAVTGVLDALARDPREIASLARVREVLNLPGKEFHAWMQKHGDAPSLRRFAEFLASGSHNAQTALADASNRLLVFLDEALAAVTSHGELDLECLVDRPTVLVVAMPESHLERLRPLFNLLVQQILDTLIRRADRCPRSRLPRPVTLFLDEFASALGRLPDMEVRLNTLRSRRVAIVAALQGLAQLEHVYGTAAGALLAGFGTKVFFASVENADASYASRLSGTMTIDLEQVQERWDEGAERFVPASRARQPVGRPLLLPGEIQCARAHFEFGPLSTWFIAEHPAFQAWTLPAWRQEGIAPTLCRAQRGAFAGRGRRAEPLTIPERPSPGGVPGPFVASRLRGLEARLGLEQASYRARRRWQELRRRHFEDLGPVLDLVRSLRLRGVDIEGYFAACARAETEDPKAVLLYLDFERERERGRARRIDTARLPFPDDLFDPPFERLGGLVEEDAGEGHDDIPF
jgi:type IV secretory pathway TraG/TraD family ATPase VirD4